MIKKFISTFITIAIIAVVGFIIYKYFPPSQPLTPQQLSKKAHKLTLLGNHDEAIRLLEEAIKKDANFYKGYILLALKYSIPV